MDCGGKAGRPLVTNVSTRSCNEVSHRMGSPNKTMASTGGKNGSNAHGAAKSVEVQFQFLRDSISEMILPRLRLWSTASKVGNA